MKRVPNLCGWACMSILPWHLLNWQVLYSSSIWCLSLPPDQQSPFQAQNSHFAWNIKQGGPIHTYHFFFPPFLIPFSPFLFLSLFLLSPLFCFCLFQASVFSFTFALAFSIDWLLKKREGGCGETPRTLFIVLFCLALGELKQKPPRPRRDAFACGERCPRKK